MKSKKPTDLPNLKVLVDSASLEGHSCDLTCLICQTPLEIHQPDMATPGRLLGVCTHCHIWTLVDADADGSIQRTEVLASH